AGAERHGGVGIEIRTRADPPRPLDHRDEAVVRMEMRRSEEHTSELQSQSNLVCRLLLEKKKKKNFRKTVTARPLKYIPCLRMSPDFIQHSSCVICPLTSYSLYRCVSCTASSWLLY